jgi:hypothetical protein
MAAYARAGGKLFGEDFERLRLAAPPAPPAPAPDAEDR